jgi:hypothetical protein
VFCDYVCQFTAHCKAAQYHAKASQLCSGFPKELDAETLKVVHATAPAVASNISTITKVFYDIMLTKYPVTKVRSVLRLLCLFSDCSMKKNSVVIV